MIQLADVSHVYDGPVGPNIILDRVNLRIEAGERVGILAAAGAGKTTLAQIIAGKLQPTIGDVARRGRLSWPISFSAAFHPSLSGAENVEIVAGLENIDPAALLARVADLSGLGEALLRPIGSYAPGMKVRLALGISLSIEFDMYLADEMATTGHAAAQDIFEAALIDRSHRAGLILLTRHPHAIRRYADRVLVLTNGQLIEAEDLDEATVVQSLSQEMEPA